MREFSRASPPSHSRTSHPRTHALPFVTHPIAAGTRVFALLGDPVSHSLSPRFQNAALRALGLDGVYVALRCSVDDVSGLVRGLARAGGGGNVTLPHKETAARSVERLTDLAREMGVCNTFWLEDGQVWGDNTDVAGVSAAIHALLGPSPSGARVVLAGAGGSARAALHALVREGAERVVVLNRTRERAEELVARYADSGTTLAIAASPAELAGETFDLAVNSTSLGLKAGDAHPLPVDPAAGGPVVHAALDLVYSPNETAWVRTMREQGIPAADGTEMLLQQGAAAFRRWWGREAPLDAMRAALRG